MQLHELPSIKTRHVQRIGRGGKRGSYSGRGVKGQKSRAGRRIRPAERELILRIPKHRGFHNKPKSEKPFIVNLSILDVLIKRIGGKAAIAPEALVAAGVVSKAYRGKIKILGNGAITSAAAFKGFVFSEGAKEKVKKAGGKIE